MTEATPWNLPLRRWRLALWLDLIRWDRPAGWLLLLWTTLAALWIAAGGFPGWHLLVVFVVGTFLMRSALRRQTSPPIPLLIINMNTARAIGLNVPKLFVEGRELAE